MADEPNLKAEHVEAFKAWIGIPIEGFKYAGLINGGGAVALLAYIGAIVKVATKTPDLSWAMGAFIGGVIISGVGLSLSYFTTATYLIAMAQRARGERPTVGAHSRMFHMLTGVCYVLSLAAFTAGCCLGVVALRN